MGDAAALPDKAMSQEGQGPIEPSSPKKPDRNRSPLQAEETLAAEHRPDLPQNPSGSYHQPGDPSGQHQVASGAYGRSPPGVPQEAFNMASVRASLPEYASQPSHYPRPMHPPGPHPVALPPPTVVYQNQQPLQFAPSPAYVAQMYGGYGQAPYPQTYAQPPSPQLSYGVYPQGQPYRAAGMPQPQQYSPSPGPYFHYQDAYGRPTPSPTAYSPTNVSYSTQMSRGQARGLQDPGTSRRASSGQTYSAAYLGDDLAGPRAQEQANTSALPRGPPRKPKQSGHALWVGNLPPGATIGALKDHFSRGFTRQIESLFLISKSNCAFVNYRTEDSCSTAMQKFHDSRFDGVRLVCRLRKGSGAASGAPTGPAALTGVRTSSVPSIHKAPASDGSEASEPEVNDLQTETESEASKVPAGASKSSDRFFIVKSLTLQDLEQSLRNGIWATQSHNEVALNKAYESAENVYLIFSANKSGEYFGYARMASTIAENASEIFGTIPRTEVVEPVDAPRTIPTPATDYAPRGHIIDDSSRGTIFWEAEHTDDEQEEVASEPSDTEAGKPTWGKAFKVEWKSTVRVPFYRTRGLRNSWNANREVKIARDGTELETGVGKRLVQLFHRNGTAQ